MGIGRPPLRPVYGSFPGDPRGESHLSLDCVACLDDVGDADLHGSEVLSGGPIRLDRSEQDDLK
jgi:hypothetical protein